MLWLSYKLTWPTCTISNPEFAVGKWSFMNCVWNLMLKFWERRAWTLKEISDSIKHVGSSSNAFFFCTRGDQHELVHFSARTLCSQVFLWFLSVYDGTYEDNQNQKSPFLVKIELHMPADSVQKSQQGCIFHIITVFRGSQSVAIMKFTIFSFILDANG